MGYNSSGEKIAKQVAQAGQVSSGELSLNAEVDGLLASNENTYANKESVKALADATNSIDNEKNRISSEMTTKDAEDAVAMYDNSNKQTTVERQQQIDDMVKLSQADRETAMLQNSGVLPSKEMYLTKDQPIQVGSYGGKYLGNVPIFAAPAALMPYGMLEQRKANLSKAAAKRIKLRDEIAKSLEIDTKEQYQMQMDKLTGDMLEYYGKATGYRYEMLKDMSNPIGRKFRNELRELKSLAKTTTDFDLLSEDILKAKKEKGEYVPERVERIALEIRNGVINIEDLFTNPKKMEEFRSNGAKLHTYENAVNTINTEIIARMKPDIEPLLEDMISKTTDEQRKALRNIYEEKRMGGDSGKYALIEAMRTYFDENEVDQNVRTLLEKGGNFFVGYDDAEKEELIKEYQEFAWNQLGTEIDVKTAIIDKFDPVKTGGTGGETPKTSIYHTIWKRGNGEQYVNDDGTIVQGDSYKVAVDNMWESLSKNTDGTPKKWTKADLTVAKNQVLNNIYNYKNTKNTENWEVDIETGGQEAAVIPVGKLPMKQVTFEDGSALNTKLEEVRTQFPTWESIDPNVAAGQTPEAKAARKLFTFVTGVSPSANNYLTEQYNDKRGIDKQVSVWGQKIVHKIKVLEDGVERFVPMNDDMLWKKYNVLAKKDVDKANAWMKSTMDSATPFVVLQANVMKPANEEEKREILKLMQTAKGKEEVQNIMTAKMLGMEDNQGNRFVYDGDMLPIEISYDYTTNSNAAGLDKLFGATSDFRIGMVGRASDQGAEIVGEQGDNSSTDYIQVTQ